MAWWIFQNVVITTALAAVVAVVCRAGRIGPVARHALWVLVLVKFVTPPLVVWPWAAPDPFGIAAMGAGEDDRHVTIARVAGTERSPAGDAGVVTLGNLVLDLAPDDESAGPVARLGAAAWPWLLGVWAAGSLCLLGIEGVRLVRLARRVRAFRAATPADSAIVSRVSALSARLGMRPVPVVIVSGSSSPVVWGFGRPRLLWPASLSADATDACIDGLLVHELAHVKRGDHLVGWIELAAGVVWWWNPLFWFVRSALREQAELACDAWVISTLPNGRRAYAESLLALSGAAGPAASSMAVIGVRATSRRLLERRLVMIMKGRAPLRLPFVGLFCLALVAAATLPAWATASQQAPPPPPPPAPAVRQVPPPPPPRPLAPAVRVDPATRARTAVRVSRQNPPPPPQPARVRTVAVPVLREQLRVRVTAQPANLTPEGQQLVEAFEKDRAAIQQEADKKVESRREAAVKALEALQDQYAKAGKLDEAVAIRDFLRAGGPGKNLTYVLRRER
jgi:beta-lactamase regulating signal transducer with metallopeptidase domain